MPRAATLIPTIVRARIGFIAKVVATLIMLNNAAEVIKKRAINLILDPGSGLSKRGVLLADNGRGATSKTRRAKASRARGSETSKKKRKAAKAA